MFEVNDLNELENLLKTGGLDTNLYEYIRTVLSKSNYILGGNYIKVVIDGKEEDYPNYKHQWQRWTEISGYRYCISFLKKENKGLLLLNKNEAGKK